MAYLIAKEEVCSAGFEWEIGWQEDRSLASVTAEQFLSEAAWVVLSAGMSERVVRKVFPSLKVAFLDWDAGSIVRSEGRCVERALKVFGHRGKIGAIAGIAGVLNRIGIAEILTRCSIEGVEFLKQLPFIGPVTAFHLAKNLGIEVVKPDRHLCRLSKILGFDDPERLCRSIATVVFERLDVIDVVLWRYAVINRGSFDRFLTLSALSEEDTPSTWGGRRSWSSHTKEKLDSAEGRGTAGRSGGLARLTRAV